MSDGNLRPPAHAHPQQTDVLAALRNIVGARHVTTDADLLAPWLTDWRGRYTGAALALISPGSTAEVAMVLKLCARRGIPVVTQGGNSGMVGGATPDASGTQLLLSTRRLTEMRIDAAGVADCGAGVVLENLHAKANEAGLRFPLSLGGKGSATIGGLVSTNAGGTQVLRHGTMRALVLGLEVVLADGQVLDAMTGLRKDNRGFELKQLFIGSEGTLGIVTRASLKLVPDTTSRITVWAGVRDLQTARQLLLLCQKAATEALEGFEVLPQGCLDRVVAYLPGARRPLKAVHAWHCLVEFVSSHAASADTLAGTVQNTLVSAVEGGLVEDAVVASSEAQADAFWALRENIAAAEKAHGPAVQHDISVPPEIMPEVVDRLSTLIATSFPDHTVAAFGHLGDGNIHYHVQAPVDAPADWSITLAPAISAAVYDAVTRDGGSISAEHGIGQDKIAALARTHSPVALDLMRRIKTALDPAGLLNPGKLVPLAPTVSTP